MSTSGCTKSDDISNSIKSSVDTGNSKQSSQVNLTSNQKDTLNSDVETADNPYFFESNISQMNYKGEYLFDDIVERDVKLNINELSDLKNGKLYELKLESTESVPKDRLSLCYFYVQKDKIYKIEPAEENLSKLKTSDSIELQLINN